MMMDIDPNSTHAPFRQPQQNWLLTYLDVFVLIVMLIITLSAIGNIQEEQARKGRYAIQTTNQKPTQSPQTPQSPESTQNTNSEPEVSTPSPEKPDNPTPEEIAVPSPADEPQPISEPVTPSPEPQPTYDPVPITEKMSTTSYPDPLVDSVLQEQLAQNVEQLGLSDSVQMKVTKGFAQLEIQDKILFPSSEADLLKAGQSVLSKLSPLLNQSSGVIYIEGHTDNRPINTLEFPSNWELGAARATSVLHFLISQNIDASRLRAITYADTQPIADNQTAAGREKNRRVNIIIKLSDKVD